MEQQTNIRTIDLKDLWTVFIRHIIPIILGAVILVGAAFGYSSLLQEDKFSSTAILYILKQDDSSDYQYTQADFSLALNVVSDCEYMLRSHETLDGVIADLGLGMDYKALQNAISVKNPSNTRILEVSVETDNAQLSKQIVDKICLVAADKINTMMGLDQVNIYAQGTLEEKPSNRISLKTYVLLALLGAVIVYLLYMISFLTDDKITSSDDVEKVLGLSVLAEVPNANAAHRGGKYGYYGKDRKSSGKKQSKKHAKKRTSGKGGKKK